VEPLQVMFNSIKMKFIHNREVKYLGKGVFILFPVIPYGYRGKITINKQVTINPEAMGFAHRM
jgi:hypothetical protein